MYLWNKSTEWVSRKTMYNDIPNGGLGMVDMIKKVKSFQIRHIMSLLYGETCKWHYFAVYWIGLDLKDFKTSMGRNTIPHSADIPIFL